MQNKKQKKLVIRCEALKTLDNLFIKKILMIKKLRK